MKVMRTLSLGFFTMGKPTTVPSPDGSAMAEAIKSNKPDTLVDRRKANDSLASELQKSHSRIGPAPKEPK